MGLSPKTPLRQNDLMHMTLSNKILDMWYHKEIDKGLFFMIFEDLKRKYFL